MVMFILGSNVYCYTSRQLLILPYIFENSPNPSRFVFKQIENLRTVLFLRFECVLVVYQIKLKHVSSMSPQRSDYIITNKIVDSNY